MPAENGRAAVRNSIDDFPLQLGRRVLFGKGVLVLPKDIADVVKRSGEAQNRSDVRSRRWGRRLLLGYGRGFGSSRLDRKQVVGTLSRTDGAGRHVGVDSCGGEAPVTKKFLDDANI